MSDFKKTDFSGITVIERGRRREIFQDLYYRVLTMGWSAFIVFGCGTFTLLNLIFAVLYYLTGNNLSNSEPTSFLDSFAFAIQTSSTVGYGFLAPIGMSSQIISMIQLTLSIFFLAGLTGLTIARISRPLAKVTFSKPILWTMLDGEPVLSFRIANGRSSHIANASLKVVALIAVKTKEGLSLRKFQDLKLQRSESPIFAFSWTILHKIDKDSPLSTMTAEEFKAAKIEIFVNFIGYESVLAQTIHAFYRYSPKDLVINHQFEDIVQIRDDDVRVIDYTKFHDTRS
jgi:inward rectifier potassium channel